MLSDQEKMLLLLKGPAHYAISAGDEMSELLASKKRNRHATMLKTADKHFDIIMQTFNARDVVTIVRTWLCRYQLPFNPDGLKTFDLFHMYYGEFIQDNPSKEYF